MHRRGHLFNWASSALGPWGLGLAFGCTLMPLAPSSRPPEFLSEGEFFLNEGRVAPHELLARVVAQDANGHWRIEPPRPGCLHPPSREVALGAGSQRRTFLQELDRVVDLKLGLAEVAELQAAYGSKVVVKVETQPHYRLESDLLPTCAHAGERVIEAVGLALGKDGVLAPILSAGLAPLIFLGVAFYLIRTRF